MSFTHNKTISILHPLDFQDEYSSVKSRVLPMHPLHSYHRQCGRPFPSTIISITFFLNSKDNAFKFSMYIFPFWMKQVYVLFILFLLVYMPLLVLQLDHISLVLHRYTYMLHIKQALHFYEYLHNDECMGHILIYLPSVSNSRLQSINKFLLCKVRRFLLHFQEVKNILRCHHQNGIR